MVWRVKTYLNPNQTINLLAREAAVIATLTARALRPKNKHRGCMSKTRVIPIISMAMTMVRPARIYPEGYK